MDVMHKSVELLMEKERVSGEEVRALFPEGVLVPIPAAKDVGATLL